MMQKDTKYNTIRAPFRSESLYRIVSKMYSVPRAEKVFFSLF